MAVSFFLPVKRWRCVGPGHQGNSESIMSPPGAVIAQVT